MKAMIPFLALFAAGCSGGGQASVSADEEKLFKNPPPVDRSQTPANPFHHAGPSFIGEPSKGSGSGAAAPAGQKSR